MSTHENLSSVNRLEYLREKRSQTFGYMDMSVEEQIELLVLKGLSPAYDRNGQIMLTDLGEVRYDDPDPSLSESIGDY